MQSNTNEAFLNWYEPIHNRFIRYCSSVSYGILETEDLAQEAIMATLQNYHRISDKNKLRNYMIGIVRNVVNNQRRRNKFHANWEEDLLNKLKSATQNAEVAVDIQFLLNAMDKLPAKQKEAVLLFEVSGFSMKEISRIQDSSLTATKTRISRGRKQLKELSSEDTSKASLTNRLTAFASILL